jgi:hypothetical protein
MPPQLLTFQFPTSENIICRTCEIVRRKQLCKSNICVECNLYIPSWQTCKTFVKLSVWWQKLMNHWSMACDFWDENTSLVSFIRLLYFTELWLDVCTNPFLYNTAFLRSTLNIAVHLRCQLSHFTALYATRLPVQTSSFCSENVLRCYGI